MGALRPRRGRELRDLYGPLRPRPAPPAPRSHDVPEIPAEPTLRPTATPCAQRGSARGTRRAVGKEVGRRGGGPGAVLLPAPQEGGTASCSHLRAVLGAFRRDGADIAACSPGPPPLPAAPAVPTAAGGDGTAAFLRSRLCKAGAAGPKRRIFLICAINRSGEVRKVCDKGRGKPAPQIPVLRPTSPSPPRIPQRGVSQLAARPIRWGWAAAAQITYGLRDRCDAESSDVHSWYCGECLRSGAAAEREQ